MSHSTHICIVIGDHRPAVINLALDDLHHQGVAVSECIVVYAGAAHQPDLAGAARSCRWRLLPVAAGNGASDRLCDEQRIDAAADTLHELFQQLKQRQTTIHLCISDGGRALGLLATALALVYFDQCDRIWHLDAAAGMNERSCGEQSPGAAPRRRLVRVPAPAWGRYFPLLRQEAVVPAPRRERTAPNLTAVEQARCQQVYDRLTGRQRDVLRAFAAGLPLQEVAEQLRITIATVNTHKTTIFCECRIAWGLALDERLSYRWLQDRFAAYFGV